MKHKPHAPTGAAPHPPMPPAPALELTPTQQARRRKMAALVCANASNETSLFMARRLCHQWQPDCHCVVGEEDRNN